MGTESAFTHTYILRTSIQSLTVKMGRNDRQVSMEAVFWESGGMVVVMESEVPLFSYPWEHFSFAFISVKL